MKLKFLNKQTLFLFFLTILTFAIYFQVVNFDFLSYDDHTYILDNANVKSGFNFKSIKWAFTKSYAANWHPITWLSHTLDYLLFKENAGYHHLENVFFHIINSILLFFVMLKITRRSGQSMFITLFFAIHPIHVESVAWIAERKDLLSTLFGFASIYCYLNYGNTKEKKHYFYSFLFFALSLMCKSMFVTLPFVFLLLDLWPLKRFTKLKDKTFYTLIIEKIPFFTLTILISIVIFIAQVEGKAVKPIAELPISLRFANMFFSYGNYVLKMVVPHNLALMTQNIDVKFLHHKFIVEAITKTLIALSLIVIVSCFCIKKIKEKPYYFVGWFWFLGTLVPVIGLVQIGAQGMADRYTYFPSIGFSIFFITLLNNVFVKIKKERVLIAIGLITAFIFTILTYKQIGYWENTITIFTRTIKIAETGKKGFFVSPIVHRSMAIAYTKEQKFKEAQRHLWVLYSNDKKDSNTIYNIALISLKLNEYDVAEDFFLKGINLNKNDIGAYNGLGIVYLKKGEREKAIEYFKKALELDPNNVNFYINLGSTLANLGKYSEAMEYFEKALGIEPYNQAAMYSYQKILTIIKKK